MINATVSFQTFGDSYLEIVEKAMSILSIVLDIDEEDVQDHVNLDLAISENEPSIDNDSAYKADITARIKNVRD